MIDKHTNIATALLGQIKARGLDEYYAIEEDLLTGKGDKAAVMGLLAATGRGTPEDKLRLAIIHIMAQTEPMTPADAEALEGALRASGAEASALGFIKRMASVNASLSAHNPGGGVGAGDSQGNLLDWADKLYGQSINAVTKGVKSLLSGGRQMAVAQAVEALMANQPSPETEEFAYFDPKGAPTGGRAPSGGGGGSVAYHNAIVFVAGGGNYLEYQGLQELANRDKNGGTGGLASGLGGMGGSRGGDVPKSVVYGTTEFVTGGEFITQLALLGKRTGH